MGSSWADARVIENESKLAEFERVYDQTLEQYISEGGKAGDYIAMMNSYEGDPLTFRYSQNLIDENTQKYIDKDFETHDFASEMERISEQERNKNPQKPGYFKLGTVELTIPPTQIAISDVKQNYLHKTLRTSSDIVLQSGHAVKAVELDIFFHSIDDINNKLRPLLAQLKATPFIPIYSDYLRKVVYPSFPDPQTEEMQQKDMRDIKEYDSLIRDKKQAITDVVRSNASIIKKYPNIVQDINSYWDGSLSQYNSSNLSQNKSLVDNMKNVLMGAGVAQNEADVSSVMFTVKNSSDSIDFFQNKKYNITQRISDPMEGVGVVAVLSQISVATVSGFPESLACHASFFVFNYLPFSATFEFLDSDNNPTTNIDQCTYFVQWYVNRFLKPSLGAGDKYFQELPGTMNGRLVMTYYPAPDFKDLKPGEKPEEFPPVVLTTDQNSVCVAISISQRNSIAFLPVLQWSTPTCQYMGAHNSEILITIDTVDEDFLNRFNNIASIVERYSRYGGDKARRANFIDLDNEVLSFCGIRKGVINSIETQTIEGVAGMNRIQISIIEFDPKQFVNEALYGVYETNERMVMEYLKYDIQKYLDMKNKKDGTRPSDELLKLLDSDSTYQSATKYAGGSDLVQQYLVQGSAGRALKKLSDAYDLYKGKINNPPDPSLNIYTTIDIRGLASFLRGQIVNKVDVNTIDADYMNLLYDSDALTSYKVKIREMMRSFLENNSRALPEDFALKLYKMGLLKDQLSRSLTYPDMNLPTYEETEKVGKGVPKITYQNLGKRNPGYTENTPMMPFHTVEPDFYFYFIPTRNIATKMGDDQIVVEDAIRQYEEIFTTEFQRVVAEYGESASYNGKKPSEKRGRNIDPDGIFSPEGLKAYDEEVRASRNIAQNLKFTIEPSETSSTSPGENKAYNVSSESKSYIPEENKGTFSIFESYQEARDYAMSRPGAKIYSGTTADEMPSDSEKDVYGGINKDSSWYEFQDSQKKPGGIKANGGK